MRSIGYFEILEVQERSIGYSGILKIEGGGGGVTRLAEKINIAKEEPQAPAPAEKTTDETASTSFI